jgi:mRNA interferase MazF
MKRGDVVLLDYPYADGSGSKVRPVLIVQNDRDNQRRTNTIVALITKNVSRVHEPTQLLIDVSTPEGQQSGLNQTSAVTCGNRQPWSCLLIA